MISLKTQYDAIVVGAGPAVDIQGALMVPIRPAGAVD